MITSNSSGVLNFNKPSGPTSRDIVDRVEKRYSGIKAGHGGTLDRLARGVLPVMVNEATKLVPYLQEQTKDYLVSCRLDRVSDTIDRDGQVTSVDVDDPPGESRVREILSRYVGSIEQIPPKFSALKKDGKRLSQWTKEGKPVDPEPRRVFCEEVSLELYDFPKIELYLTCGKGFYVRSLVRDIGLAINGEGGLVTELVRTRYGPFRVEDSVFPEDPEWDDAWYSPLSVLESEHRVRCDDDQLWKVLHGQRITRNYRTESRAVAVDSDERLHAILEATEENGNLLWQPCRVLNR